MDANSSPLAAKESSWLVEGKILPGGGLVESISKLSPITLYCPAGGSLLVTRERDFVNPVVHDPRDRLARNLRLGQINSQCILPNYKRHSKTRQAAKIAQVLKFQILPFDIHAPSDPTITVSGTENSFYVEDRSKFRYFRVSGMSELQIIHVGDTDDYIAEGGDGEYIYLHQENIFLSAAWTTPWRSAGRFFLEINRITGIPDLERYASLEADDGIETILPSADALGKIALESTKIAFATVDYDNFSASWSRGVEQCQSGNSDLSEATFVVRVGREDLLVNALRATATNLIQAHAGDLVEKIGFQ